MLYSRFYFTQNIVFLMINECTTLANNYFGLFQIALGFYGTRFLINHSGSDIAKLAIDINSECLSLNVSSDSYANCTYRLEKLVKNLTESGEIQVENCELDDTDETIAYCPVWVWYFPQWLPLTDITVVGIVGGRTDSGSIRPSKKLEKILSKLGEASRELTDLTDRGKLDHFNKLENILASKSGILEQLSDLSDRGKDELSSDQLEQIFSTMIEASRDLNDELDNDKALILNNHADLIDTTNDIIPQEMKQIASKIIVAESQNPENANEDLIINSLQTLTKNLNLGNLELLKAFPEIVNPSDIENLLKQSNLIEKLSQNLKPEEAFKISMLTKSLVSSLPEGTSPSQSELLNIFFQHLDLDDVADMLQKSGLIEALVHHITTTYLDEAFEKSGIEQALVQNLKTNPFFQNTLKSSMIEAILQHLQNNESHSSFENFGFLLLLASSLEEKGLDQSGLMQIFLQHFKIDDIQALLGKSDLITDLIHNLETNLLLEFHQKSDLEQALVDNIKTNHYIESSQKTDIMKRLMLKPENEDEQNLIGNLGLPGSLSQISELEKIQNPFISLKVLKFLAPRLDTNVLENSFNKFNLLKAAFQNANIADVEGFLSTSGIMESLVQNLELNHPGPKEEGYFGQPKEQDGMLDHYIENALVSHILRRGFSNSETKDARDSPEISGLIKAVTNKMASTDFTNYDLPGKLGQVKSLVENINENQNLGNLLKTSLLNKLLPHTETNDNNKSTGKLDLGEPLEAKLVKQFEKTFNIPDIMNNLSKNENLFQNDQLNADMKLNHQTKEEQVMVHGQNDDSKVLNF